MYTRILALASLSLAMFVSVATAAPRDVIGPYDFAMDRALFSGRSVASPYQDQGLHGFYGCDPVRVAARQCPYVYGPYNFIH